MSDGVEDHGAEEALWGVCHERIGTSVLEAISRASGSSFSALEREDHARTRDMYRDIINTSPVPQRPGS